MFRAIGCDALASRPGLEKGEEYLLIVEWARMSIVYKTMKDLVTRDGTQHQLSKKEFCRLIKDATLLPEDEVKTLSGR